MWRSASQASPDTKVDRSTTVDCGRLWWTLASAAWCCSWAGPWPTLTHHCGLQVDHDGPGHVLPIAGLAEERGEGVIVVDLAGLCTKGAISLDAMLQAEELPAGIADLDPSLAHMDRYAFPLQAESRPVRTPAGHTSAQTPRPHL